MNQEIRLFYTDDFKFEVAVEVNDCLKQIELPDLLARHILSNHILQAPLTLLTNMSSLQFGFVSAQQKHVIISQAKQIMVYCHGDFK